jgi:hypothetical protein
MPVTAKLSQAFYDRLGQQVAGEMVDWFNQVDTAYRSDLRELSELNFARFDAKLGQRFAESSLALERRLTEFSRGLDQRFAGLDPRFAGLDQRFGGLEREIAKLAVDLKDQLIVQTRWMIGIWVVVLVAVIGLWIRR